MDDCIFCKIVRHEAPCTLIWDWPEAMAFVPLNPVVEDGHVLVIPKIHVKDFRENPDITALTMKRAAELAGYRNADFNLITSAGSAATQTVFHLHVHLVVRTENDGLKLPWSE